MERVESKILHELASSNKNFWEILQTSDFLLKDIISSLKKLKKKGAIGINENGFFITERGRKKINPKSLELEVKVCKSCEGKSIVLGKKFSEILENFKKIVKERPLPKSNFFQGYMFEIDVISRIAFMHHHHDIENKKIVLIGDDDLLSIGLALTELPSKILVLDIDERIGKFIEKFNEEYGYSIEFRQYDVSNPLPKSFEHKFDVFSSEPLETFSGMKAFIFRGITCLKKGGVGYFGLTRYESSLKKWLEIQKFLNKMKCVITDLIPGFSVYPMNYGSINYENFAYQLGLNVKENKGVNWYKSALFRFEVLNDPPLKNKKMKIDFVDEEEDLTHPSIKISL